MSRDIAKTEPVFRSDVSDTPIWDALRRERDDAIKSAQKQPQEPKPTPPKRRTRNTNAR